MVIIAKERGCEIKQLGRPDEVRVFDKGRIEIFKMKGTIICRGTFEPGWRWSLHLKPIVGTECCEYEHIGCLLSGTMRFRMRDGREYEVKEGDMFYFSAGHDTWVVGDREVEEIDFQGYADYAKPKL